MAESTARIDVGSHLRTPEEVSASVLAVDRRTDEVIASHAPDRPLAPASNTKLVTAALGFEKLGPDYRFETTLHAMGERRGSRLVGDLVLTGRGAPDLSQAQLMALAEQVREAGIEVITGEIVLDASAFGRESLGPGWTWDDQQFDYGAKSTPIAVEGNTVEIALSHRDNAIEADVSPQSRMVRLDVDVDVREGAETAVEMYKKRASEVIRVEGEIAPGATVVEESPVDDPMMHCGSVFRDALEAKGVTLEGWTSITREPTSGDAERIGVVRSAPLSELIGEMLVNSRNFTAEQLARTLALDRSGTGSWSEWERAADEFLRELDAGPARIRDGSGISRYNLLSASGVVTVLEWCLDRPWGARFHESLPLAGSEGTVGDRLSDLDATVHAKTGSLTGTRTLSGYIGDVGDPDVTFACLLSNLTDDHEDGATDVLDDLARAFAASR